MGENLHRPIYAGNQLNALSHLSPGPPDPQPDTDVTAEEEEPYTIKCICGFDDDDGETVLDEHCNTWQHVLCYYYPDYDVPDLHLCVDCRSRELDAEAASLRQQRRRRQEPNNSSENGRQRRAQARPSKKRTKDSRDLVPEQNGVTGHDPPALDRSKSALRDQQPPNKKPKLSHRHTPSTTIGRSISAGHVPQGPFTDATKFPLAECPPDFLSPEFIHIHQRPDFVPATANTHVNLSMANLISHWLDDKEAFSQVADGKTQDQVLIQAVQSIEDLEQPIIKQYYEDKSVTFHGSHPVWPYLTVENDVLVGEMLGELRGGIGLLDNYKADPRNNWDKLRHPEHFVFFHPALPLYIDCRAEGTLLRHARHSCRPNMDLKTIITGERELRYCYTAVNNIPRGTELTLPWEFRFDEQWLECLQALGTQQTTPEHLQYLSNRVNTVLAHFGGCACESLQNECLIARFDKRAPGIVRAYANTTNLPKKGRKPKKGAHGVQIQYASRSGSEAVIHDDEHEETRSTSRSSRSKTREASPSEGLANDGTAEIIGLSERERKKLMQQERLFNKMEHDEQNGQKKKKRASGTNMPSAINPTKQPGRNYSQASMPATPAASAAKGSNVENNGVSSYFPNGRAVHQNERATDSSGSRSPGGRGRSTVRANTQKSIFVHASTQTDATKELLSATPAAYSEQEPFSLAHRLIARSMRSKPGVKPRLQVPQPRGSLTIATGSGVDVEMKDAEVETKSGGHYSMSTTKVTQPGTRIPPPPPWPSEAPNGQNEHIAHQQSRALHRSVNLHVDLPPPPRLGSSFNSMDTSMTATPGVLSSHSTHSSYLPAALPSASSGPPLLTPLSGTAFAQPSPIKKKMSLSAYTAAKLKAKTPGSEQTSTMDESAGSPQESRREPPVGVGSDQQQSGVGSDQQQSGVGSDQQQSGVGSDQQQPVSSPASAMPPPTQKETQKDDVDMT